MEFKFNTKEFEYDDDFCILFYNGKKWFRASYEYFEEAECFDDLECECFLPEGYTDDDWEDFFKELMNHYNEETGLYEYMNFQFAILDV